MKHLKKRDMMTLSKLKCNKMILVDGEELREELCSTLRCRVFQTIFEFFDIQILVATL